MKYTVIAKYQQVDLSTIDLIGEPIVATYYEGHSKLLARCWYWLIKHRPRQNNAVYEVKLKTLEEVQ